MRKVQLAVEGMSCDGCRKHVEEALMGSEGVEKAKVNLKKKEAKVKVEETGASDETLIAAIDKAGYQASVK